MRESNPKACEHNTHKDKLWYSAKVYVGLIHNMFISTWGKKWSRGSKNLSLYVLDFICVDLQELKHKDDKMNGNSSKLLTLPVNLS